MFFVCNKGELDIEMLHDRIADRIKTSISLSMIYLLLAIYENRKLCLNTVDLLEMALYKLDCIFTVYIFILEDIQYFLRRKLLMLMVRYTLNCISKILTHLWRQVESILLLQ